MTFSILIQGYIFFSLYYGIMSIFLRNTLPHNYQLKVLVNLREIRYLKIEDLLYKSLNAYKDNLCPDLARDKIVFICINYNKIHNFFIIKNLISLHIL